ncbi:MAG TPA: hypothetical protein VGA22_08125 [Gemmatimonadales bacterium]|jgi:hypothetical protein
MTEHDRDHEIAQRLAQLPTEGEPVNELWQGIEARMHVWPGLHHWPVFAQLAAASVLFAVGLGTGWALGARPPAPSPAPAAAAAMQLAAEVQRTGTEYVAALAAFASIVDSMSADVRLQGREAAISALLGAAKEWAQLQGQTPENMEFFQNITNERDKLVTVRF